MSNYEAATLETIRANTPLFAYSLGAQDERQRIIKLLEGYALKKCDVHCAYSCECFGKY